MNADVPSTVTLTQRTARFVAVACALAALALIIAVGFIGVLYFHADSHVDRLIQTNTCRARASAEAEAVLLDSVARLAMRQPVDPVAINDAAATRRASVDHC